MKFLIQKINGKILHDFSRTLLESIDFQNWLQKKTQNKFKFINTNNKEFVFTPTQYDYIPIGSVDFVIAYIKEFYQYCPIPKPKNVPSELFEPYYTYRPIFNGNEKSLDVFKGKNFRWFVKTNDKIKGFCEVINTINEFNLPKGNYQFSEYIDIDSEWRAFVYENKLVGLQNYCGNFTKFPNVDTIKSMINAYKSAPIAYTLDVGVNNINNTFVIETHDFYSSGLYGFADHRILPQMFYKWFNNYINLKEK